MSKTLIAILLLSVIQWTGCKSNQKVNNTTNTNTTPPTPTPPATPNPATPEIPNQGEVTKQAEDVVEYTITLPPIDNPDNSQIEFYPAQYAELDCNYYSLTGNFQPFEDPKTSETKYMFKNPNMIGTLKACPNTNKSKKWVKGPSIFLPYNSNYPIKVLVPYNMEVKYRIWSASELMNVKSN